MVAVMSEAVEINITALGGQTAARDQMSYLVQIRLRPEQSGLVSG
jgi:hypothetical protein